MTKQLYRTATDKAIRARRRGRSALDTGLTYMTAVVVIVAVLIILGGKTSFLTQDSRLSGIPQIFEHSGLPAQDTTVSQRVEDPKTSNETWSLRERNKSKFYSGTAGAQVKPGAGLPSTIHSSGTKERSSYRLIVNTTTGTDGNVAAVNDDLAMPDWKAIITPEGAAIDRVGRNGYGGTDGTPDYLQIYPAFEAGYVEEVLSNGIATDTSALLIDKKISNEVLYNGEVRREHDLGNAFYLLGVSQSGNLRIYVGVERLLNDLPTFIEFEFNQELVYVGSGIPWWHIRGVRRDGDLLVRFNLVAGNLTSVELARWQNNTYQVFESDIAGLSNGCRDRFNYLYCMGAPPLDRSNQLIEVWDSNYEYVEPTLADSFAELGLDIDRLGLAAAQDFSGVFIRTPEDVVMTSFRSIGKSNFGGAGAP